MSTPKQEVVAKNLPTQSENKNNQLWSEVYRTDPAATKSYKGPGGFSGTAINTLYPVQQATTVFGPMGSGWGVEIVDEQMIQGAPIYLEQNDQHVHVCNEMTHTLRVEIWANYNGEMLKTTHFGHTPYITKNKWGAVTDHEYAKKSLSDAIKKALTLWGFSADIFMGDFDDPDYVSEISDQIEIEKSDDKAEEALNQRQAYKTWADKQVGLIETATSANELEHIFVAAFRKAKRKDDTDLLTAITKAKDARKKELLEKAA